MYWEDPVKSNAAWSYVACLSILSHVLRTCNYSLRSGCELERIGKKVEFHWTGNNEDEQKSFSLNEKEALELVQEALLAVKQAKVEYDETLDIKLSCNPTIKNGIEKTLWKNSGGKKKDEENVDEENKENE